MPDDDSESERFLRDLAAMPAITPPDAIEPEVIGRFRVIERIGAGGMGVVYRARDESLAREVALKVLPPHFEDDEERRRRFFREARAAAAIDDANVARVLEVGEESGRAFVAMELVRGETLRARLGRGALGRAEAIRVAKGIARALVAAHARGVVHRDLKPENVMIADGGAIKVLDFGLAKVTRDGPAAASTLLTEEGRILGTPGYMSPEQALGGPTDARTDVFSFGVILYECLAGNRPFVGESAMATLVATARDEPRPLGRDVPRAVARVVVRCLAKQPEDRFASVGALVVALERAERAPARGSMPIVAGASAAVIACAAAWAYARPRPPLQLAAVATALSASARRGIAITDHPAPRSSNADALRRYAEGLERTRHGRSGACAPFAAAAMLDPDMSEALLRLALCTEDDLVAARPSFQRALDRRAYLDDRDRGLLDAYEPYYMRQPADVATAQERMHALLDAHPDDAEIAYDYAALLGVSRSPTDREVLVAFAHVVELDPEFGTAIGTYAQCLAYSGRFDDGLRETRRCVAMPFGSVNCRGEQMHIEAARADCAAVESDARNMLAMAPGVRMAYPLLASALVSRAAPLDAAREVMRTAESSRLSDADVDDRRFAILAGDFTAAEKSLTAALQRNDASPRESEHGELTRDLLEVYAEIGDVPAAKRLASDYLRRRDGWEPNPRTDDTFMFEATPIALGLLHRTGAMTTSAFQAARRERIAWWRARSRSAEPGFFWFAFFARAAETPDEAREALAELPGWGRVPPFSINGSLDADVGRVRFLAGPAKEALPVLERGAGACEAFDRPIANTRATYFLGRAREETGDVAGACAAYGTVLARWGKARPRSVTADLSRARSAKLCAK